MTRADEWEVVNFMESAKAFRDAVRDCDVDAYTDRLDEIEIVHMHTRQPALRSRAAAILSEYNPLALDLTA